MRKLVRALWRICARSRVRSALKRALDAAELIKEHTPYSDVPRYGNLNGAEKLRRFCRRADRVIATNTEQLVERVTERMTARMTARHEGFNPAVLSAFAEMAAESHTVGMSVLEVGYDLSLARLPLTSLADFDVKTFPTVVVTEGDMTRAAHTVSAPHLVVKNTAEDLLQIDPSHHWRPEIVAACAAVGIAPYESASAALVGTTAAIEAAFDAVQDAAAEAALASFPQLVSAYEYLLAGFAKKIRKAANVIKNSRVIGDAEYASYRVHVGESSVKYKFAALSDIVPAEAARLALVDPDLRALLSKRAAAELEAMCPHASEALDLL